MDAAVNWEAILLLEMSRVNGCTCYVVTLEGKIASGNSLMHYQNRFWISLLVCVLSLNVAKVKSIKGPEIV